MFNVVKSAHVEERTGRVAWLRYIWQLYMRTMYVYLCMYVWYHDTAQYLTSTPCEMIHSSSIHRNVISIKQHIRSNTIHAFFFLLVYGLRINKFPFFVVSSFANLTLINDRSEHNWKRGNEKRSWNATNLTW